MKRTFPLALGAVVAGLLLGPTCTASASEPGGKTVERVAPVSAQSPQGHRVERRIVVRSGGSVLGVRLEDLSSESRGAKVRAVEPGSAAAKAGIKVGDIIVRFDGEPVRSAAQLARLVRETPAGRVVPLEVTRGGAAQKLNATLAEAKVTRSGAERDLDLELSELPEAPEAPEAPRAPRMPHAPLVPFYGWHLGPDADMLFRRPAEPPRLGIEFIEMGEQLSAAYKLQDRTAVLVTSVDEDSAAAKAGLKAGDVILALAGQEIQEGPDLREAVNHAEDGEALALKVQRDGKPIDLTVTLSSPPRRQERRSGSATEL